jgi:hypothetical protein
MAPMDAAAVAFAALALDHAVLPIGLARRADFRIAECHSNSSALAVTVPRPLNSTSPRAFSRTRYASRLDRL